MFYAFLIKSKQLFGFSWYLKCSKDKNMELKPNHFEVSDVIKLVIMHFSKSCVNFDVTFSH